TSQFPEIAAALAELGRQRKVDAVIDGEIVALDSRGQPTGFQQLQGRVHLGSDRRSRTPGRIGAARHSDASLASPPSVALIAFDLLREDDHDLRNLPLTKRRTRLEKLLAGHTSPLVRISEQVQGDGRALYQRALASGWEGLIAKDAHSTYKSGKRTPEWRKLKILQEQEFVVGGWTEPRQSRAYFGALLLGVYEPTASTPSSPLRLVYVGHIGTGFN